MIEDRIENLLHQADAAAGSPEELPADFLARVRRSARRRKYVRVACGVGFASVAMTAAVVVVLSIGGSSAVAPPAPSGSSQQDIAALRVEIDRLRAEIDLRVAAVERMLADERKQRELAQAAIQLNRPDPAVELQMNRERAAFVLAHQAGKMQRDPDKEDSAVELYHKLLRLFPNTRGARTARQRLSELQKHEGDSL